MYVIILRVSKDYPVYSISRSHFDKFDDAMLVFNHLSKKCMHLLRNDEIMDYDIKIIKE